VGFGSQQVPSAMEFEVSLTENVPADLRLRILAFDWWIRNHDRGERNPNLLWSAENRGLHVIDHDQAGYPDDASIFWGTHLFKAMAPAGLEWLPPNLVAEFSATLADLLPDPVLGELPSEWTTAPGGVAWFINQLNENLTDPLHRDWRKHE
jgi:hypothetical protein